MTNDDDVAPAPRQIADHPVYGSGTDAILNRDDYPDMLWNIVVSRATE